MTASPGERIHLSRAASGVLATTCVALGLGLAIPDALAVPVSQTAPPPRSARGP